MDFKRRVKKLRKEYGLTQDELAEKIGVARSSVANYENGLNFPNKGVLVKMCKLFNCDLECLLGIDDIPDEQETKTVDRILDLADNLTVLEINYLIKKLSDAKIKIEK